MHNHVRNPSNRNRERCKTAVQNNPRRSFCMAAFSGTKEWVEERWQRHCDFASASSVIFAWTRMCNCMFWFRTTLNRETGSFVNSSESSRRTTDWRLYKGPLILNSVHDYHYKQPEKKFRLNHRWNFNVVPLVTLSESVVTPFWH